MKTLLYGDLWFSEHDPFLFAKIFNKFVLSASPSQTSDYIVMAIIRTYVDIVKDIFYVN